MVSQQAGFLDFTAEAGGDELKKSIYKLCAIAMSTALLAGMLGGCGKKESSVKTSDETEVVAAKETHFDQYMGQGEVGSSWIAAEIQGAVTDDYQVSIVDDYFASVTKNYLTGLVIKPGHDSAGVADEQRQIVSDRIEAILTDESITGSDERLLQTFYELSEDWTSRNKDGIEPIAPYIEEIEAISKLSEMTAYLSDKDNLVGAGLFGFSCKESLKTPGKNVVWIEASDLSLSDTAAYKEATDKSELEQEAFEESASYMLKRLGYNKNEINEMIDDCEAFEAALASQMFTEEELAAADHREYIANEYTLDKLSEQAGSLPIDKILKAWGYNKSDVYNVPDIKWLTNLGKKLYREENLEQMKHYMLVHTAVSAMTLCDEKAYNKRFEILNTYDLLPQKWDIDEPGIYYTETYLADVVDKIYAAHYCSEEEQTKVVEMTESIIDAYREMLKENEWLSADTKKKAMEKLDSVMINACMPSVFEDYTTLRISSRKRGGAFFEAVLDVQDFRNNQDLARINQAVDTGCWEQSLRERDIHYNAEDNSINIMAGFLTGEYSMDASYEQQMGTTGTVIAHELCHVFDPAGAMYNKSGKYEIWWNDADYEALSKKAEAVSEWYSGIIPYKGAERIKGDEVMIEAIADMSGVEACLTAVKAKKGFDYDYFFSEFARSRANIYTKETVDDQVKNSHLPLEHIRVNTTVSQFEPFYNVYEIKEGDGMYIAPENRISVW